MMIVKILIWTGLSIVTFAFLVGLIFVLLTVFGDNSEVAAVDMPSTDSTNIKLLSKKQNEVDSTQAVLEKLGSELFFSQLEKDSLRDVIGFKDGLIAGYEKTIVQLKERLTALNERSVSIKELAKTYETMKPNEIRPILEKVDDTTVIVLYKNMSSRNRKSIFQALPGDRAAAITKQIAGVSEG